MNKIFFSQNSQNESSTQITISIKVELRNIYISFLPITHKCPVNLLISGICMSGRFRGLFSTTLIANTDYSSGVMISVADISWQAALGGGDTPTTIDSVLTASVDPNSSSGYTYSTSILYIVTRKRGS